MTLDVIHGGFATGGYAAGGPLRAHESQLLARIGVAQPGTECSDLNLYFAGDDGRADLRAMLESGTFRVEVPEEAALLVASWLLEEREAGRAAVLLESIMPWFAQLRFYRLIVSEVVWRCVGVSLTVCVLRASWARFPCPSGG